MILRVLKSAAVGFIFFCLFSFIGEYNLVPVINTEAGVIVCVIICLVLTVYTFVTTKTKNTIIEDIAINKMKIMKAEQEAKLQELNK